MTLEELCKLMHTYGISKLRVGDTELERPANTIQSAAVAAEPEEEPHQDPFERLSRMSPDAVDRALMLSELPNG